MIGEPHEIEAHYLTKDLEHFHNAMHGLRKDLTYFVKNIDYPLELRWSIFIQAHDCLKYRMLHVPQFIHSDPKLQKVLHEHFDYGQEIMTTDYVYYVENSYHVKEEFLAKNCGSFFYVPPPNATNS